MIHLEPLRSFDRIERVEKHNKVRGVRHRVVLDKGRCIVTIHQAASAPLGIPSPTTAHFCRFGFGVGLISIVTLPHNTIPKMLGTQTAPFLRRNVFENDGFSISRTT